MPRERREASAILKIAGPLVASDVGTIAMACTDSIIVGRAGAAPLAALGFASAYQLVVLALLTGTLSGVSPLVARTHGAGDARETDRLAIASIVLAVMLTPIAVLLFMAGGAVAGITGEPAPVRDGAATYLAWLSLAAPSFLLFAATRSVVESTGRTRPAMIVTAAGVVANALLALLLVPWHGIAGAAIATCVTRVGMAAAMVLCVTPRLAIRTLEWQRIHNAARRIVRTGLPIGAHWSLELAVFAVAAAFAGRLGVTTLAAWQVALNAVQMAFFTGCAIAGAGAIRLGQALGADRSGAADRVIRTTYRLVATVALASAVLFVAGPRTLASLYSADPRVVALATPCLVVAGFFTIADQLQGCALTLLHGAADTIAAAAISIGGSWLIGVPLAWIFSELAPANSVWSAAAILAGLGGGALAAATIGALRVRRIGRMSRVGASHHVVRVLPPMSSPEGTLIVRL